MQKSKPTTAILQARNIKKAHTNESKQLDQKTKDKENIISNFEQHKALKILQKEAHISSIEQRVFLANYLRRHVQQFRELEGDPMEFLLSLTLNLKYSFFPKGKVIFHENENEDDLFFILDGDVQFYSRKTEDDIKTEHFWLKQVETKIKQSNQLSQQERQRLLNDEQVLNYYKSKEDEAVFRNTKRKNQYFLNNVLLFKKTYQRNKAASFGINQKDNSQTAVAKTDLILAVTSQKNYIQSYTKYKEKNQIAFDSFKKQIMQSQNQPSSTSSFTSFPTQLDDNTIRHIASKTIAQNYNIHEQIISEIPEGLIEQIPNMPNKNKAELGINETIFIVKSGLVEYYSNYIDNENRGYKVRTLNEGDLFGHECFLQGEKQRFTVLACSKETQILQLKKQYITENEIFHEYLNSLGNIFYSKLQQSLKKLNGHGMIKPKNHFISQHKVVIVNQNNDKNILNSKAEQIKSGLSNIQKKQDKQQSYDNLPAQKSSKKENQNSSPQIQINSQPFKSQQLQQQPESQFDQKQTIQNSENLLKSPPNLKISSQPKTHPKSQQFINSSRDIQTIQIKNDPNSLLNISQNSQRRKSLNIQQEDFEGSFDYLDEQQSSNNKANSISKEDFLKRENDIHRLKQKSRIIISARSCTQIPQQQQEQPLQQQQQLHNSPSQSTNDQQSNINSPYLQIPQSNQFTPITYSSVQLNRKSLSSYTSPLYQPNFRLKMSIDQTLTNNTNNIQPFKLNINNIKDKLEEAKISPQKQMQLDNNDNIGDLKTFLKIQRNAKIPPTRQPEEFRIKNNMFDTTTQCSSINNNDNYQNEDLIFEKRNQLNRRFSNRDIEYLRKNNFPYDLKTDRSKQYFQQQQQEQYNYDEIENQNNLNFNINKIDNQQSLPQSNFNYKSISHTEFYKSPLQKTQLKIQSPSQIHYLNFKQKHLHNNNHHNIFNKNTATQQLKQY